MHQNREGNKMLKIRLKRLGRKKSPAYRIIVINSTTKREGRTVQELGHYDPKTKIMKLDKATALDWIKKGAQPTETVQYLINNCTDEGALNYKPKTEKKLSKKALAKVAAEKESKAKADEETKAAKIAAKEAAAEETKAAKKSKDEAEEASSEIVETTETIAEKVKEEEISTTEA